MTDADLDRRRPGRGTLPETSSGLAPDGSDLWQEAQDRVLLYLKKLGMPALLSLEIAHRALRIAADERPGAGPVRPIQLAMRALHIIFVENNDLLKNTPYWEYSILYRRWHPENLAAPVSCDMPDTRPNLQSAAIPPINRGSMNIRKI